MFIYVRGAWCVLDTPVYFYVALLYAVDVALVAAFGPGSDLLVAIFRRCGIVLMLVCRRV